jgi:hypothetical protein
MSFEKGKKWVVGQTAGTVAAHELGDLFDYFDIPKPELIQFPYNKRLTKQHTLLVEQNSNLKFGGDAPEVQYNYLVTESMADPAQRI